MEEDYRLLIQGVAELIVTLTSLREKWLWFAQKLGW